MVYPGFGESEVFHLACGDQVLHRARYVFDWHVRVDAMLIEQVDHIGPQSPEEASTTCLMCSGRLFRVREGSGVVTFGSRSQPNLVAMATLSSHGLKRFSNQFLVRERPITFRRVEERHAAIDSCPDERRHFNGVTGWPRIGTHTHAAEPDC